MLTCVTERGRAAGRMLVERIRADAQAALGELARDLSADHQRLVLTLHACDIRLEATRSAAGLAALCAPATWLTSHECWVLQSR